MTNQKTRDGRAMSRRDFVTGATSLALLAGSRGVTHAAQPSSDPIIITSWQFGSGANAVGWPVLERDGLSADAVEAAINHVELLPDEFSVGYGGSPNVVGETTLDAMLMWGPTHDVGAVGCLKRVKRAISVARKVMEETRHTLLVGDDATRFAASMGFEETSLTNAESLRVWEEWVARGERSGAWGDEPIAHDERPAGHDTVGSMAVDARGNLCVGCSTNGGTFKLPGRVGDSPIPGAGAYCDADVGAAIATGNGDVMMRFLPTYHTVEAMRHGASPAEAARAALERIAGKGYRFDGGIIAMSTSGAHGAAKLGWESQPLTYAVHDASGNREFSVDR